MTGTLRTPLAMAILSTLRERPMHPYDIRRTMRERQHDRVIKLRGGSLYSTIERLEADGMIVSIGTQRAGRRPERTVYDLTPDGEAELLDWLRTSIVQPGKEFPLFGSIVAFLPHLMPSDAAALLRQRVTWLEAEDIAHRETMAGPFWAHLPRLFRIHEEYAAAMRAAEIAWVIDLTGDIEAGRLTWPPVIVDWHSRRGTWVADDAPDPEARE
jgi:DNA-binding PadR family transcriptional regulator